MLKLFRESLRAAGNFTHVVATKIDKPTEDRPHFFMAYATKDYAGLKTFRDNEYKALQAHAANRAHAKGRKQEAKSGMANMFVTHEANVQELTVDDVVAAETVLAGPHILAMVGQSSMKFCTVAAVLMETYMLRETNVKDLILQLANDLKLDNTWGGGRHKPSEDTIIRLARPLG